MNRVSRGVFISPNAPRYMPIQFLPTMVNGRWRGPEISRRWQAELKKKATLAGKVVSGGKLESGEWDPAWDLYGRTYQLPKAHKGAKFDREKSARVAAVKKNMLEMPKRMQEFQEKRDARSRIPFVEKWLTKHKLMVPEKKDKAGGGG